MNNIGYERVRELFRYDPVAGELYWRKSRQGVNTRAPVGCVYSRRGYKYVEVYGVRYRVHRLVWLYHHGYLPEHGIDHIDRKPANKRLRTFAKYRNLAILETQGIEKTTGLA